MFSLINSETCIYPLHFTEIVQRKKILLSQLEQLFLVPLQKVISGDYLCMYSCCTVSTSTLYGGARNLVEGMLV